FDRAPPRPWTRTTGVGCGAVGSKPSRTSRPSGIEAASVPSADSSPATACHHAISSRPVQGARAGAGQEDGVDQADPFPPVGLGLEALPGPAEGDVGVLPVLDQLAGDEDASALVCGLHDAPSGGLLAGIEPAEVEAGALEVAAQPDPARVDEEDDVRDH